MKKFGLVPLVLIVAAGCSNENDTGPKSSIEKEVIVQEKIKVLPPPIGRWIANSEHCDNKLDIRKSYVITIAEDGAIYSGASSNSGWEQVDSKEYKEAIDNAASSVAGCLKFNVNDSVAANISSGSDVLTIVYDEAKNVIFRVDGEKPTMLVQFSNERVQDYELVDSMVDLPMAYDPYAFNEDSESSEANPEGELN